MPPRSFQPTGRMSHHLLTDSTVRGENAMDLIKNVQRRMYEAGAGNVYVLVASVRRIDQLLIRFL